MLLKIGELAKRIGLTIRALHHYDAIGLVRPSGRSEAGYRLYNRQDIARLHRIQALRGLGLSLAETGTMLDGGGADLHTVIRQQIVSLERQVTQATELRERLQALDEQLTLRNEPDLDQWLSTLGMMGMYRKYFTKEEIDALRRRKAAGDGSERWPGLVAEVRDLMDRRISPQTTEAKALATRWIELSEQTLGSDPRFIVKLGAMHRKEFSVQSLTGVDGPLLDFIMLAAAEIRCELFARYLSPVEVNHYRKNYPRTMHAWQAVFAETRQLMDQGVAPEHPDAQALFLRWVSLFQDTWGKDPATRDRVREAHRDDPRLLAGSGTNDPAMKAFVERGMKRLAVSSNNPK